MASRPHLGEALKTLAASEPAVLGPHLPLAVLVAYREGSLPENEAEEVREHLVLCRACSEQLLDLAEFEEAAPHLGDNPLSEGDVAAAWEKLKVRLPEARTDSGGETRARPRSFLSRFALPLAACVALSATFIAVRWTAHNREAALRNPQNFVLEVGQGGTRGPEDSLTGSASRPLALYARGVSPEVTRVRVEILRALDGNDVWSGEDQQRGSDGEPVALGIVPAGKLEPGSYTVVIYGDGRDDPLDSFSLILI